MTFSNEVPGMRTPNVRSERGVALVIAIVALVVIGALVAGAFFMSSLEQKTATNTVQSAQAFQAAEAGMQNTIGNWDMATYGAIPANDSSILSSTSLGGSVYQVKIFPLNSKLFLLKSSGTNAGVTQTLASVVQVVVPSVNVNASMSVTASVTFNGNSFLVSGVNTNPPNSSTCPGIPTDSVKGVRSSTSTGMGSHDDDNILGTGGAGAVVANDTSVTTLMNTVFATNGIYNTLRASVPAALTFPPATYNGVAPTKTGSPAVCEKTNQYNWGEPYTLAQSASAVTQCSNYYPTVLGTSTFGNPFKITGGRGQGVLLADGDLELTGGFEWYGLILTKGSFKITGTGAKIFGAVVAQNGASVDDNTLGGNTTVQYSSCSIYNALKGSATLSPLAERSWTQMF